MGGSDTSGARQRDTWLHDGLGWTRANPATSPPGRSGHVMAFDAARGRIVLFGGIEDDAAHRYYGDTWEWDGATWTQRFPVNSPSPRRLAAVAYDSHRQRTVFFSGKHGYAAWTADTWEWDGDNWIQRHPAISPPARDGHAMVYDARRNRVVMFGGYVCCGYVNDTWEWDGAEWTQRHPATSPPPRGHHAMAYDTARERVILFGGTSSTDETWAWDGMTWGVLPTTANPGSRTGHAMTYDSTRREVMLFGGGPTVRSAETWALRPRTGHSTFPLDAVTAEGTAGYPGYFAVPRSRTQTLMMAEGFSSRAPGSVTALSWRRDRGTQQYAARRVDLAVRFGTPRVNSYGMSATFAHNHAGPLHEGFRGLVDVPAAPPELVGPAPFVVRVPLSAPWAWDGGDMLLEVEVFSNTLGNAGWEVDMQARQHGRGTVTLLGTGCSAGWGTPRLVPPDPRSLIPGGAIDTRLTHAPPGSLAAAWFGNRTDEWNGVPLPFTFPGTGCTIYTNNMVGVILPVFGDGATPLLSVPLPPDPIIHGLTVYSQWGVFDLAGYPPIIPTDAFALTSAAAPSVWFDSIANLDGSATGVRSSEVYAAPVVQLEVR